MIDQKKKALWFAELKSCAFIIFIALVIRIFMVEPFFIPSSSMKDTLLAGDYVFATKYSYGYSKYSMLFYNPESLKGRFLAQGPERGDVIIFRPPHEMSVRYIKRLIGMPGDKIQLINNIVYINDKPLNRDFVGNIKDSSGEYKKYVETLPNGLKYNILQLVNRNEYSVLRGINTTKPFMVPKEHYFFLGDNRDQSRDSRFELGFVPFENFIAKAQFTYFSDAVLMWLDGSGIKEQFQQTILWFQEVRWNRIFRNIYNID